MCLYPKLIKNKKYIPNKKNGGIVPDLPKIKIKDKWVDDTRVLMVPIGCGKCMECMKQKKNEWRVRLLEEIKNNNKIAHFVTLTYSNEEYSKFFNEHMSDTKLQGYDLYNEIATKSVRYFLERWRKDTGKSVKHWLITELGHVGTENIHLHGIIWTNKSPEYIKNKWKYGYIWDSVESGGYVNDITVNYITKYCTKIDLDHKEYKPKILTSKGIGSNYTKTNRFKKHKFKQGHTKDFYITPQGNKIQNPIYYRNKLYSDNQKELLWLNKLDKNVRYVDGTKIDISSNHDEYYRRLEKARIKNKRLGFGDDEINWNRIQYEKEKAIYLHKKRLKNE